MEHLFIYPVLLFVTYLLYKVLKMKAGRNRLWKAGVFQMDSIAKGRVISVENRNIHFIIVTDEYLSVSGLDTTK